MEVFRCDFVNDRGEIVGSEKFSAPGVDMAVEIGSAAMARHNHHAEQPAVSIEVWCGSVRCFAGKPYSKTE